MTQLVQLKKPFVDFIVRLFTRATSAFIIILGRRETGKTDFGLLITEILESRGIMKYFATNIKIYESPFHIEPITNLEDLKFWSANNKGKKLFIFDEYGKAMRRRTPMSRLNIKLIDELQILRKHKLSTIAITVNEKYIDNAALGSDILDGFFLKPFYKNQKVALYEDLLNLSTMRLKGIPRTSIKFDTWDVAPFKEYGVVKKPKFKSKELANLWDWCHGKTSTDLGLHTMQLNRLSRKYVKEYMERERNTQQV